MPRDSDGTHGGPALFGDGELAPTAPKVTLDALAIWNEFAGLHGFAPARVLDSQRRAAMKRAVQDYGGLAGFRGALEKVCRNDFILGKVAPKDGRPPFKATLDWFIRPITVRKVLEDFYQPSGGPQLPAERGPFDPASGDRVKLRNYRPGGFWPTAWGIRPEHWGCSLDREVVKEWREVNRVPPPAKPATADVQSRLADSILSYRAHGRYEDANRVEEKLAKMEGRAPVLVPAPDARNPDQPPRSGGSESSARTRKGPIFDVEPEWDVIPE